MLLQLMLWKFILQFSFFGYIQMEFYKSCPTHCICDGTVKCFIFHESQSIACQPQWKSSSIIVNFNLSSTAKMERLFVNCSKSNITAIMLNTGSTKRLPSSFLFGIVYLERLIVNGPGNVEQLDNDLFANSIYLKAFKITGHNLKVISENWFSSCLNIQELYLPNNRIETISNLAFRRCRNLKIIDLRNNNLQKIYKNTFRGLLNLYKLILTSNRIFYIESLAFSGFNNIHTIDLSHNKLLNIGIGAFFQIPNLINLLINDNQISAISIRAFKGLDRLSLLNLKNNSLSWLDELIFEEMRNLHQLELDSTIDCVMKKKQAKISKEVQLYLEKFPPCIKESVTQKPTNMDMLALKSTLVLFTRPSQIQKNYVKTSKPYPKVQNPVLNKTCFNCTVTISCFSTHIWISFLAGVMTLSCFVLIIGFAVYVLITQRIIHNLRQYRSNQDCLSMVTTNTRESHLFPQSKCDYKSINGHIECDVAL